MTSLRELQGAMAAALAGDAGVPLAPLVVGDGLSPDTRVAIYRNNVRVTFLNALETGYPALVRLVGADYFRQLTDDYREQHPSTSGNLQHAGAALPAYLAARFAGTRYAYLADVAALEWAYQEVLFAADGAPLDVAGLATLTPADYERLCLELSPAARLLESRYPTTRIWRANRPETLDDGPIDLDAGGERVLLLRIGLEVEIHRLPPAEYAFLATLAAGEPLPRALDAAAAHQSAAPPESLLARFVAAQALVGFRLADCAPRAVAAAR